MTIEQEAHLHEIKEAAVNLLDAKYRKGAEEHGGDIMNMSATQLVDEAIYENIDQLVYLLCLRSRITEVKNNLSTSNDGFTY